jgi:DNA primase
MPAVYDLAEWPLEARVWLFKAGFSHEEIRMFGLYYHPPTRRVVLPVVERGSVTFWQARRIFGTLGAKYLSMPGGRENTLPLYGSGQTVTLVEDLLSCFKIATAGRMSLCLMGTSLLTPAMAWLIKNQDKQVLIWLDPDRAGMNAAASIQKQLALCGINSKLVSSEKDPKFYSKQGIRNLIDVTGHIPTTNDASTEGLRQVNPSSELALIRTTDRSDPH